MLGPEVGAAMYGRAQQAGSKQARQHGQRGQAGSSAAALSQEHAVCARGRPARHLQQRLQNDNLEKRLQNDTRMEKYAYNFAVF